MSYLLAIFSCFQAKKRKVRKRLLILLVLIICFWGRGVLFRAFVRYDIDQEIPYSTNVSVPEGLRRSTHQSTAPNSLEDIAVMAQRLVARQLSYSLRGGQNNPNKGHCVDYARLWSVIAAEILRHHNLEGQYTLHHYRGYLYSGSLNLHQFLASPSFRDHDFNGIRSPQTEESFYLDASLYDYTGIRQIRVKKKDR